MEIVPDADVKINLITWYLFSLGQKERAKLAASYEEARRVYPEITSEQGEAVFRSLNCAGCHPHDSIDGWQNGPDLREEGRRVRREWLAGYLAEPVPVRPFGFYPGSGSRMPDFSLSAGEINALGAYIIDRKPISLEPRVPFAPRRLSAYAEAKAERLLRDKLPCLGCHQLDGEGGMIGPDLSQVSARLTPEFIHQVILDPQGSITFTIMPKIPMPEKTATLIVNYLLQRSAREAVPNRAHSGGLPSGGDLSLVYNLLLPTEESAWEAPALYRQYCAPCHGPAGDADGYNVPYLPVQPKAHNDGVALSLRPDDTLFDVIYGGGAILNRSHRMPAFGQTLSRAQIWQLVRTIRELCQCEGPAWSRDSPEGG